jgi:hypothetical protein
LGSQKKKLESHASASQTNEFKHTVLIPRRLRAVRFPDLPGRLNPSAGLCLRTC